MEYTVYLVFAPHGEWHEGHLVHVKCEQKTERAILNAAMEKLDKTHPELMEWCLHAHLILEGRVKPKYVFKR